MANNDVLTAEQVAEILHLGRHRVYEMARSGELPSYKIGRKLFFRLDRIEAYLDGLHKSDASNNTFAINPLLPDANAEQPLIIAGQGLAADLFVDRLEQMSMPVSRTLRSSYGGLIDLYANRASAALIHLYDQRTNTYNVPFVQRLAPGMPMIVFRLVKRSQGFAVAKGNPSRIASWGALLRDGIRLANRTKGCGSRVLLDEKLISMEVDPFTILGYESNYSSGVSAAEAVASGLADVAVIGEEIAARVEGIEFVPLQHEWLDLAVAKNQRGRELLRNLKSLFGDASFRSDYERIVHGSVESFGSIVYEC